MYSRFLIPTVSNEEATSYKMYAANYNKMKSCTEKTHEINEGKLDLQLNRFDKKENTFPKGICLSSF